MPTNAEQARDAIENVCAGKVGRAQEFYDPRFLHGTNRGRAVQLSGITISRLENGKIVEDWGSTDSIELVRQLGIWRSALMLATEWRLILELARARAS